MSCACTCVLNALVSHLFFVPVIYLTANIYNGNLSEHYGGTHVRMRTCTPARASFDHSYLLYIYSDSPCISIDKNIIYFFQSSSNFIGNDQEGENEVFEAEKKKKFEKRFPRNWSGQMMSVNPRFSLHNRHSIRPMSSIIDRFH